MTPVDVLFRYARHPQESAMQALGNAREVYGIRRIVIDQQQQTIRVEYDATRLNRDIVAQLLRRSGISITEEISLIPPQPPPADAAAPAIAPTPTK